jgi:hypothetical protein
VIPARWLDEDAQRLPIATAAGRLISLALTGKAEPVNVVEQVRRVARNLRGLFTAKDPTR